MGQEEGQLFGKDEGFTISLKALFKLGMVKEVAKVDMEESACGFFKHVVTCMSVSNPKDVGCNTLAGK